MAGGIEDGAEFKLFTKKGVFLPQYGSALAPDRDSERTIDANGIARSSTTSSVVRNRARIRTTVYCIAPH